MPVGTLPFKPEQASILETEIGQIPYWILFPEGYSESYTRGSGNSTSLILVVNWEDSLDFKKYALGFTTATPGLTYFNRRPPMRSEYDSSQHLMQLEYMQCGNYSEGVDEEGIFFDGNTFDIDPVANNWPIAGWVAYKATFGTLNWSPLDDFTAYQDPPSGIVELGRYMRKTSRTIPKERKIPNYIYETQETPPHIVPEVGFVPIYEVEYIYTMLEVPYDAQPTDAIQSKLLKLNEVEFDGKPPETMFFKGLAGEQQPYVGPNGELYIDLPLVFGYRPQGWNQYPIRPALDGGAEYVRLKKRGAADNTFPPYAKTTFDELFRPPAP